MAFLLRNFVVRQCFLAVVGMAIVAAGQQVASAEPSAAMLGVVPADEAGHVIVQDIYVGSPAHTAGIRPGDQVVAVDGKTVDSAADLLQVMGGYAPDATVVVQITRNGWSKPFSVKLAKREDVIGLRRSRAAFVPPQRQGGSQPQGRYVDPEWARKMSDPYYRQKYLKH